MKNLDTIDVQLEDHGHGEYISLVLNGEVVKGTFDYRTFAILGGVKSITFEVMTCSCGHAGCAGIFDGTAIKRRRYTVEWRDIDCGLPKKFYNFDVEQYDATTRKALEYMYGIVERRVDVDEDSYWYDGICNSGSIEDLESGIQYTKDWFGFK